MKSTVTCLLCSKEMKQITSTHLKSHSLTMQQYRTLYPNAEINSEARREKMASDARAINARRDYSRVGEKISATKKKKFADGETKIWCEGQTKETNETLSKAAEKISKTKKRQFETGEVTHWNTGRATSDETKEKIRASCLGQMLNEEQKKKHLEAIRRIVSSPNYINAMKNKSHTNETKKKISEIDLASMPKKRASMEAGGYWIPLDQVDALVKYRRKVWKITNANAHLIPSYDADKRGLCKKGSDNHQVDHIYSITDGFLNNVPPEIIGHPANLRFIRWEENLAKFNESHTTIEELIARIENF